MQFSQILYWSILQQADLGFENETYKVRDRINIAKKALEVLDVVYEGNYGLENRLVAQMSRYIAAMEVLEGDVDATLDYLEKAAEHAIIYDTLPQTFELTSTLLNGYVVETRSVFKNFTGNDSTILYNRLSDKRYDIVRDTERFKAIIKKLAEYVVEG